MMRTHRNRRLAGGRTQAMLERLEARQLLNAAAIHVWQIHGDTDPKHPNDTIIVQADAKDPALLKAIINGKVGVTRRARLVDQIKIDAGKGNDIVRIELGASLARIGTTIWGGPGNDSIVGGFGNDLIHGGDGNDTVFGGEGNDTLLGEGRDDELTGGSGRDVMDGGRGRNRIHGLIGDRDVVRKGGGKDAVDLAEPVVTPDKREQSESGGSDGGGTGKVVSDEDVAGFKPAMEVIGRPILPTLIAPLSTKLNQLAGEAELKAWIIDSAVKRYAGQFGKPAQFPYYYTDYLYGYSAYEPVFVTTFLSADSTLRVRANGNLQSTNGDSYSTTNTQVANVDEADLVETNGEYIYAVSGQDVVAVKAMPADGMQVESRTAIEGTIQGIYLHEDRLTVISTLYASYPVSAITNGETTQGAPHRDYSGPQVKVTVLDVSDPEAVQKLEETKLDGSLMTSRAVGGRVYVILNNYWTAPAPRTLEVQMMATQAPPPADGSPAPYITEADKLTVYESEASYRAWLEQKWQTLLGPQFETTANGEVKEGALLSAPGTYVQDADAYADLTSIALFDVDNSVVGPDATTTLEKRPTNAYASEDSLYLTGYAPDGKTEILKLELRGDSIPLVASGAVSGSVLNQFSMDERDGYFRIATTEWNWPAGRSNNLYVLEQDGADLEIVGGLSGLAAGEQIQSVSFVDKAAYVVTFRQTDPFWVIDLSDPATPTVTGELQVPGFSKYLQVLDDRYVLGVGQSTGSWGSSTQMSLFDVSDPTSPKRVGTHDIGSSWNDPMVRWNWDYHAINYFAEQGIIAIPVTRTDCKAGLEVLKIDAESGFAKMGNVEQDGGVWRSVVIGPTLFSIGPTLIKAQMMDDLDEVISSVTIGTNPPPSDPLIYPLSWRVMLE